MKGISYPKSMQRKTNLLAFKTSRQNGKRSLSLPLAEMATGGRLLATAPCCGSAWSTPTLRLALEAAIGKVIALEANEAVGSARRRGEASVRLSAAGTHVGRPLLTSRVWCGTSEAARFCSSPVFVKNKNKPLIISDTIQNATLLK